MKFTVLISLVLTGITYSASVSQNVVSDNQRWFSDQTNPADLGSGPYGPLSGYSSITSTSYPNAIQHFDERSLTFTDLSGTVVDELFIVTDLIPASGTPQFDDAFAVDLNGDNTIDYAFTQNDALNSSGITGYSGATGYDPWTDASPMIFEITITTTGTTINALWKGANIELSASSDGFNNASSLTLADLGFNPDGSIPNDNFTTSGVRLGPINSMSGSAGSATDFNFDGIRLRDDAGTITVFDPDGDGTPAGIPEPSSSLFLGLSAVACILRRRR